MHGAIEALLRVLPEGVVIRESEELYGASMDNLRVSQLPTAVIRPRDEEDIRVFLQVANSYGIAVTTRGAGSSTTGASMPSPDGWVLDLSGWKEMHIDADSMMAYVQPGVTVEEVDKAARTHGLFYPPDPGSKRYATIGGTLACNAGGLRGAKYGVTRDYVFGLEGFMANSQFVRWGLDVKKYVSGYNIRDLWVGSEGTLGIITGAVLKLLPIPPASTTLLAAFPTNSLALDAVQAILRAKVVPSILEFLDEETVTCFARKRQGVSDWLSPYLKGALLLIEADGHAEEVKENSERITRVLSECDALFERATNPEEAERLWTVRRGCSQAMFLLGDTKLNEDIVVPFRSQHTLMDTIDRLRKEIRLPMPTFGHAADGNFHVHIMYHYNDAGETERAKAGIRQLMEAVVEMGGAITGEHGIGMAKTLFMDLQHSPEEIRIMRAIKHAFDPNNILNPDKIFGSFEPMDHPREKVHMPWDH